MPFDACINATYGPCNISSIARCITHCNKANTVLCVETTLCWPKYTQPYQIKDISMFASMDFCLFVCLFVFLFVCLFVCLFVFVLFCVVLFLFLFLFLFVCLFFGSCFCFCFCFCFDLFFHYYKPNHVLEIAMKFVSVVWPTFEKIIDFSMHNVSWDTLYIINIRHATGKFQVYVTAYARVSGPRRGVR